jgi:hypothetical protein
MVPGEELERHDLCPVNDEQTDLGKRCLHPPCPLESYLA